MKQFGSLFLAFLLAWVLVFSAFADAAPETAAAPAAETAPSSAAPPEGAAAEGDAPDPAGRLSSLEEYLRLASALLESEDFRHLMEIEDFQYLLNDVLIEAIAWLLDNKPVTLQILSELGVKEEDCRLVEEVWSSAERIKQNLDAYFATPDGAALIEDINTLMAGQTLRESLSDFLTLLGSDDLELVLAALTGRLQEDAQGDDTVLVNLIRAHGMNPDDSAFVQARRLFVLVADSPWARDSLPRLLSDDTLWSLLERLSKLPTEPMLEPTRQELLSLDQKPEIMRFIKQVAPVIQEYVENHMPDPAAPPLSDPSEKEDSVHE